MPKKKVTFIFYLVFGIILFLFSYELTSFLSQKEEQKALQKGFQQMLEKQNDNLPLLFESLTKQNEDTIGWIRVLDTDVDYPVVQSEDNLYYLNHSFFQQESEAGFIFADYRNDFSTLNKNNIIYGHGRLDGTMFGSLQKMLSQEWFSKKEKHYILFLTPTSSSIWQIFSVYTIQKEGYYLTTYFSDDSYFLTFLNIIKDRSVFDFPVDLTVDDKILTLSTCQDNFGKRMVVHAKLIEKETTN